MTYLYCIHNHHHQVDKINKPAQDIIQYDNQIHVVHPNLGVTSTKDSLDQTVQILFLFLLVFQQGYNISSSNTAAFHRKAHIDNNTKKPYCKAFNFKGKRKTLQQIKKSYYSHSVLFFQIYLRSMK